MAQPEQLARRSVLKSIVSLAMASAVPVSGILQRAGAEAVGTPLEVRQLGEMDIHHIDTGRGNCTLKGGDSYRISVVDSEQEKEPVKAVFGPYMCRAE